MTAMPLVLSTLSYIHAISGELAAAEALLDEIEAATEATGTPSHHYVALWIAALRGRSVSPTYSHDEGASVQHKILGTTMPVLEIELDAGESIVAESTADQLWRSWFCVSVS